MVAFRVITHPWPRFRNHQGALPWQFQAIFSLFEAMCGLFWPNLGHFQPFLSYFGQIWTIFSLFEVIFACFRPFWAQLEAIVAWFWPFSAGLRPCVGYFGLIWAILSPIYGSSKHHHSNTLNYWQWAIVPNILWTICGIKMSLLGFSTCMLQMLFGYRQFDNRKCPIIHILK